MLYIMLFADVVVFFISHYSYRSIMCKQKKAVDSLDLTVNVEKSECALLCGYLASREKSLYV